MVDLAVDDAISQCFGDNEFDVLAWDVEFGSHIS